VVGPARVLRYGPDPSQHGELTLPDGDPRGVVVVVHGGFWKAAYGLDLGRPLAMDLAERGWAVWNLEYRRVGNGGGTPATFADLAAGIDLLAEVEGLDVSTVAGVGHSAGGHLVTWAAGRSRPRVPLSGVVSQAGVLDLVAADRAGLGSGAVRAFLGHPAGPADAAYDPAQRSPLDVPVRCVHAADDDVVPVEQSRDYVARATAEGADASLALVTGGHYGVIDPRSAAWAECVAALRGLS
jgi:acetyl esterase/lipase